jgi:hypothetical protein
MAAHYPVEIDQGTVWRRRITLRTGTPQTNEPLDLTGRQIHAQVRENWASPVFVPFSIENIEEAEGGFDLVLDDCSRCLRKPDLFWDLLITAPDGTVAKYLQGPVKVRFTITRPS